MFRPPDEERFPSMLVCRTCLRELAHVKARGSRCPGCGGPLEESEAEDPLIGRELDARYTIRARIGRGGMGTVYRATQHAMRRDVAIKVLSPYYATRPRAVRRFVKEARAASRLNHPNIVTLYDFGQAAEGYLYIAMELLEGQPLTALLRKGPMGLAQAVSILDQVAAALTEAHAKGVVHCDLKPDNIFVTGGERPDAVKVLDFGIATIIAGDMGSSSGTSSREVCGTPDYMSPERILGRKVGPETDLYSLGVILYELLAGQRPFMAAAPMQVCLKHLNDAIPHLPTALTADGRPTAPVQDLLALLLAKEPDARIHDAEVLRSRLRALLAERAPADEHLTIPDAGMSVPEPVPMAPVDPSAPTVDTQSSCRRCGHFNPGHWRFCGTCGDALDVEDPCGACGAPVPRSVAFCPDCGARRGAHAAPARRETAPHQPSLSRRPVAVVHALVTFEPPPDQAPAGHDREDLEDRLDATSALLERWSAIVLRHGGTLHGEASAGLRALFGAPRATERDAERAARCALALRVAFEEHRLLTRLPLVFRCGIATGLAIQRGAGKALQGDVLIQAALLAGDAPPGEVVVSGHLHQELGGLVIALPQGEERPVALDRQRWLLRSLRSADATSEPPLVEGVATPLVGRAGALGELQGRVLTVVHTRMPHIVTLTGPAGVGKSRLVHELVTWVRETLSEAIVVSVRASVMGDQTPYQAVREALATLSLASLPQSTEGVLARVRSFAARIAGERVAASVVAIIGASSEAEQPTEQARQQGFLAVMGLFGAISAVRPLVLVLDNAHAADAASLGLLVHVAESLGDAALLVICVARPELSERHPSFAGEAAAQTRIELGPLDASDAQRLARALLQRASLVPASIVDFLTGRSGGNPLFMEELVKLLVQRGVAQIRPDGSWSIDPARLDERGVPRSIQGLLHARIDALAPDERAVLQAAAVVGRTFWTCVVERLVGATTSEPVSSVLESLERRGMVVACGDGLFAGEHQIESALLHDVAYGSLLKRVQRQCHAEVAAFIAEEARERLDDVAALLARHYDEGGEPSRAFHLYRRAAQRALAVFANEDAISALGKALALQQAAGEAGTAVVAELHEELGDVLLHTGQYQKARREFLAALATPGASVPLLRRADLHRKIGKTYYLTQDLHRALEMLQGALEAAGPQPSSVAMDIHAEIGWVHYLLGHPDESERQLRRGMELAHALGDEGRAQHGSKGWARALANLQSTLGGVALSRGRREEALALYEGARAHFWSAGLQANAAGCDLNMGLARLALGRAADALEPLQSALELFEMLGHREGVAGAQCNLGRANHRLGRLGRAEGHLMAGRTLAEELGAATRISEACAYTAELSLDRGQVERALVEAHRAVDEADRSQVVELRGLSRRVLGTVLVAARRPDEAGQAFEQALDLFGTVGQPDELAATCEAYGRLCLTSSDPSHHRNGETLLRRAADIYRETGLPERAELAEDALNRGPTTAG